MSYTLHAKDHFLDAKTIFQTQEQINNNSVHRIVNVTHQIPVEIFEHPGDASWTFRPRRGHSAMYSGIASLQRDWETIHIGWTGKIYNHHGEELVARAVQDKQKEKLAQLLQDQHRCIPLFLDSESVAGHYDGYCKTSK